MAMPSWLWHKSDMVNVVNFCVIFQIIASEERGTDGCLGMENIFSINSNAEVTPR